VPPNRKSGQDEAVLKELRDISHMTEAPRSRGLNYVLTKNRKRTIAT
jgi:hypothetical protein